MQLNLLRAKPVKINIKLILNLYDGSKILWLFYLLLLVWEKPHLTKKIQQKYNHSKFQSLTQQDRQDQMK